MIRVKFINRNEVVIFDNGKIYTFDKGGRCSGEDTGGSLSVMENALDLPIISILSSNGKVNIGVSTGHDEFKAFDCSIDSMKCATMIMTAGSFIKMLRRDGVQNNIKFNQLLYIYPEGTDLSSILNIIGIKEV